MSEPTLAGNQMIGNISMWSASTGNTDMRFMIGWLCGLTIDIQACVNGIGRVKLVES